MLSCGSPRFMLWGERDIPQRQNLAFCFQGDIEKVRKIYHACHNREVTLWQKSVIVLRVGSLHFSMLFCTIISFRKRMEDFVDFPCQDKPNWESVITECFRKTMLKSAWFQILKSFWEYRWHGNGTVARNTIFIEFWGESEHLTSFHVNGNSSCSNALLKIQARDGASRSATHLAGLIWMSLM